MRYIDYGNKSDYLSRGDIYTWDTLLEKIPPQAVACSFYRAPEHISEMNSMTMEDMEVFSSLMKQSSPMKMKVHQCLTNAAMTSYHTGSDVSVSLRSKDGKDILTKLSLLPNFKIFFNQNLGSRISVAGTKITPLVTKLTVSNVNNLDHLALPVSLHPAPHPLHLDGEELAMVCDEEPTSPIPSLYTSKAVEKVQWWLDRTDAGEEFLKEDQERRKRELIEDVERRNKQLRNPIFQEPEFVQSENTKNKASMLGQARGQMDQEDNSLLKCFPVTSRAKKVCRSTTPAGDDIHLAPALCNSKSVQSGGAYPSVDVRADMTRPPQPTGYTPPRLASQDIEVPTGSFTRTDFFHFFISLARKLKII